MDGTEDKRWYRGQEERKTIGQKERKNSEDRKMSQRTMGTMGTMKWFIGQREDLEDKKTVDLKDRNLKRRVRETEMIRVRRAKGKYGGQFEVIGLRRKVDPSVRISAVHSQQRSSIQ